MFLNSVDNDIRPKVLKKKSNGGVRFEKFRLYLDETSDGIKVTGWVTNLYPLKVTY